MHLYWKYNHFGKSWYQVMKSIATLARVFKNPPSANYTSKTTRHLTGFRSASWRRSDRQVCLGVTVRWGPKFWHSPVSKTQTENDFTKYTWPSDLQWVVFPNSLMGESAVKYRVMVRANTGPSEGDWRNINVDMGAPPWNPGLCGHRKSLGKYVDQKMIGYIFDDIWGLIRIYTRVYKLF